MYFSQDMFVNICCVKKTGITQEQIDEIRLVAENSMLADMQNVLNDGGSLEFHGKSGETPVTKNCICHTKANLLLRKHK